MLPCTSYCSHSFFLSAQPDTFTTSAEGFLSVFFPGLALMRYSAPGSIFTITSVPPITDPHDVLVTHITDTSCIPGSSQTLLPRLYPRTQRISLLSTFRIRTFEFSVDSPRTRERVGDLAYCFGKVLQLAQKATTIRSVMCFMI